MRMEENKIEEQEVLSKYRCQTISTRWCDANNEQYPERSLVTFVIL